MPVPTMVVMAPMPVPMPFAMEVIVARDHVVVVPMPNHFRGMVVIMAGIVPHPMPIAPPDDVGIVTVPAIVGVADIDVDTTAAEVKALGFRLGCRKAGKRKRTYSRGCNQITFHHFTS